jgi:tetratricopeptide (TPR) repeat protein
VQLFLTTAQRISPQFEPTAGDLVEIARICRMAQGMPLALILAAGWIETLSPAEIAIEMGKGLGILATDSGDLPARLRSMRTVFDSSWALVDERRREVFRGLSVFRGGFTRQAAQYVTGATLDELMALVNRARLHRTPGGRFEVHELLRQYAQEKLDQTPDSGRSVRDQHCAYYMTLCKQWGADLKGPRQQTALAEMGAEIDNARAAWDWAAQRGHVEQLDQALTSVNLFYGWRLRIQEGEAAFRLAADKLSEVVQRSPTASDKVLRVLIKVLALQGDFTSDEEAASRLAQQCLALLERPELADQDVRWERALVLLLMAYTIGGGSKVRSLPLLEQSLALFRSLDDRWWTASALKALGIMAWRLGDFRDAQERFLEYQAISQSLGDSRRAVDSLWWLSVTAFVEGRFEDAERLARQHLTLAQQMGDRAQIAGGFLILAIALLSGQYAESRSAAEQGVRIYEELGSAPDLPLAILDLGMAEVHLGWYEQAGVHLHMALVQARATGFLRVVAGSLHMLGWIALVQEGWTEAQRLVEEGIVVYRKIEYWGELGMAQAAMAYVTRGLGQRAAAESCLSQALRSGVEHKSLLTILYALPAASLLALDEGKTELAVELDALARRYPLVANSSWFGDIAGRHISAAAATLAPELVEAAQVRGRMRDLEVTVGQLLEELVG